MKSWMRGDAGSIILRTKFQNHMVSYKGEPAQSLHPIDQPHTERSMSENLHTFFAIYFDEEV